MFQKRTLIIVFVIVALGLVFGTYLFRSNHKQPTAKKVEASSANSTMTTQAEWDAGTKTNTKSMGTGDIELDNVGLANQQISLSDKAITTIQSDGTKTNAVDGDWSTYFETDPTQSGEPWWQVDMGSEKTISKIKAKYAGYYISGEPTGFLNVLGSTNGSSWDAIYTFSFVPLTQQEYDLPSPATYRYIRTSIGVSCEHVDPNDCKRQLYELQIYQVGSTGTHTTGATQIDGGANFWQWESSTPAQSTPANTSITYRYRTSANSTDWTAWVSDIGSVTSRTGDDSNDPTKYRYLQIEATLSNTDGTSTPTIDSYSIGYHTNQKPNAPTAMTAVIN